MQADIYADGFRAQKSALYERSNPFPMEQQPDHATWRSGWKRGELVTHPGSLDGAITSARIAYIALHGDK